MASATEEEITGNIEMATPIIPSSRITAMREWISKSRASVKPWGEFLSVSKFSKPGNAAEVGKRIMKNVEVYQSNYIIIVLLLTAYCVLTSPLLLIAISVAGGGCWYVSHKNGGKKIKLFGREFSTFEQYGLVVLLSLPLLFLASAGSTVFWIIGASIVTVLLHASFFGSSSSSSDTEELTMEEVVVQ